MNSRSLGKAILECDIQSSIVEYLEIMAAQCGFLFFSVPNEGIDRANPASLAKLKRMGFRPGVADHVIMKAGRAYFLEVKRPGGELSDNQAIFGLDATHCECPYSVAWSFEDALEILRKWKLVP